MAYDIFFLSYNEPNAVTHWNALKRIAPTAKRIDNVSGIYSAHQACAKKCMTSHFFVVDADNDITHPDVFKFQIPEWDKKYVHLWYAQNAVNDLEYGWGGLKLFPKKLILANNPVGVDMTTSFELKIIPEVVSISRFNSSAYEAWRSGFREVAKLTVGVFQNQNIDENNERISIWTTTGMDRQYGDWCIQGAKDGRAYAESLADVSLVNDWGWLEAYYTEKYGV